VLQTAMGWGAFHLYDFDVRGDSYGPKDMSWNWRCEDFQSSNMVFDDREVTLALALPRPNLRLTYNYNPKVGLQLNVILQRTVSAESGMRYPRCVDGGGHAHEDGSVYHRSRKIGSSAINRELAELSLRSLSPESGPPSVRDAAARREFREWEHPKSVTLIGLYEVSRDRVVGR